MTYKADNPGVLSTSSLAVHTSPLVVIAATILILLAAAAIFVPMPKSPRFETARITRSTSADVIKGAGYESPGGVFIYSNLTLRQLISRAYGLPEFRIAGGPHWIDSEHFNIIGNVEGEAEDYGPSKPNGRRQLGLMTRTLLAERFKLTVHRDVEDLPVYMLTLLAADREIPWFQTIASNDCAPAIQDPHVQTRRPCTIVKPGKMTVARITIPQFAAILSGYLLRPVLDRTGLKGTFDFTLDWSLEQSVFSAIQQQVGLKLEPTKTPIDVLVIDYVEKPTNEPSDSDEPQGR